MDKETFGRAYSLFREVRYFKRKLGVAPDMPYYLRLVLNTRYQFIDGVLNTFYKVNPTSEKLLNLVWYHAAPAYPPLTARQRELSRRLYRWRIDHRQQIEKDTTS